MICPLKSFALSALVIAALVTPGVALALGSITDGDVTFSYTSFNQGFRNTTDTDYTGAGAGDQMWESWWFFRVTGDTREYAFAAPDTDDYSLGNYATLDWADVNARGLFSAQLNVAIVDPGVGGNLYQEMNITAVGSLILEVFHYTDYDVGGTPGDDTAVLDSAAGDIQITVTDGGTGDFVPFIGYGADHYEVTPWRALLTDLTNNGNTGDLGDTGLPFATGDFTGGFQWSVSLNAGETATLMSQFGANAPLLPPIAMPTPEPGTGLLLGLGLAGLALRDRRPAPSA